jgi:twitching motility protein PilT
MSTPEKEEQKTSPPVAETAAQKTTPPAGTPGQKTAPPAATAQKTAPAAGTPAQKAGTPTGIPLHKAEAPKPGEPASKAAPSGDDLINLSAETRNELSRTISQASKLIDEIKHDITLASNLKDKLQGCTKSTLGLLKELEKSKDDIDIREMSETSSRGAHAKARGGEPEPMRGTMNIVIPETSELDVELEDILKLVVQHEGSDLHLKVNSPPVIRIEGELIPVGNKCLSGNDTKRLILNIMTPEMVQSLYHRHELDFSHTSPCGRFRVNAFLQKYTVSASMRLVKAKIPSFKELYLPSTLEKITNFHNGLFLVTGPAGTGKSTTLASLIDYLNETKKLHIITIEDPIEFILEDKSSIITQREVGIDTESFEAALKMSLRQDPNVIMLGELRDAVTVEQAVMAAETGHLVLATLHTPSTVQAIRRLLDFFPRDMQEQFRMSLATTLRGIVSQRLLRRIDQEGRIPAVEILFITPTVASLIREGNFGDIYEFIKQGMSEGMITFTESLARLCKAGFITQEDALHHAEETTELKLTMAGRTSGSAEASVSENKADWLQGRI